MDAELRRTQDYPLDLDLGGGGGGSDLSLGALECTWAISLFDFLCE